MFEAAKKYFHVKGFDSLQDFIRELMRERLFETDGYRTYLASEEALSKEWLSEDKAWAHLQKET